LPLLQGGDDGGDHMAAEKIKESAVLKRQSQCP
jgi:hypothetical protein